MNEVRDSSNVLYDLLEKEVISKQYVLKNNEKLKDMIASAEEENEKLHEETIMVQQTYHLTDSELEAQRKIEKQVNKFQNVMNYLI